MFRLSKSSLIWLLVTALLVFVTYGGLAHTFYQQDEWQEFGLLRSGAISLNPFVDLNIFPILIGQGRLFSDLLLSFLLLHFPFQMGPFVMLALFLHLLNVYLVFQLTRRLSGSVLIAGVASLAFALNAVAHQAVTWMAAIATLPATGLILFSILAYLEWLDSRRRAWLYASLASLFVSLLFKEIGIFLVIGLPLLYLLDEKKPSLKETITKNAPLLGYGLLIVVIRVLTLAGSHTGNGTIAAGGFDFKLKILWHALLYPLTGLFQTLVPSAYIYPLAKKVAFLQYPLVVPSTLGDTVPQTIITDLIATIGTVAFVGLALWLARRKPVIEWRFPLFAIGLTMLSFLPYVVLDRGGSYMDSRYYYVAAIGTAMLIGLIFDRLWQGRRAGKVVAILLLAGLLTIHILDTRGEIKRQTALGAARQSILSTIKTSYPTLSQKNIFYITGDKTYDTPTNFVPFQQGLGYTLMVWYADDQAIPQSFLANKFLWDIGTQGYQETALQGFGFFSQLPALQAAVKSAAFDPSAVMAFSWDSRSRQLTDISARIQEGLQ